MSYAYCKTCDAPMNSPSADEVWLNRWECRNQHSRKLTDQERIDHLAWLVIELTDRVATLETSVNA